MRHSALCLFQVKCNEGTVKDTSGFMLPIVEGNLAGMAILLTERKNICKAGFLQAASGGSGSPSTSLGNEM